MSQHLFTSESVSEGHPDKVADQISDAVLDAVLAQDPRGRVACETLVSKGFAVISGEITTNAKVDFTQVARKVVTDIGYDHADKGFDGSSCAMFISMEQQSPDIAMGVDESAGKEQGAGDQGIMFGYAVNETPEYMPLTLALSHKLVKNLADCRKSNKVNFLWPDSKSQVTAQYDNGNISRVDAVVISSQHSPEATNEQIRGFILEEVIQKTIPKNLIDNKTKFYINPTGRFVVGGPKGDAGLTGRKIIVDTYGGHGAHGGGAFSGKDPSKVDRSAAYAARHVAKNIVASGLADKCLVQLSYAIGVAEPVSINIETYGTGKVDSEKLTNVVREIWGLKPAQIVKYFDLLKPKYLQTAAYGHFGRNEEGFTWEKTEKVADLKNAFNIK